MSLYAFKRARASKRSFVANIDLSKSPLDILPPLISTPDHVSECPFDIGEAPETMAAAFGDICRVESADRYSTNVNCGDVYDFGVSLSVLGFGDFDHDGV